MDQGFFINFLSEYCGIDKTLQSCLQGIYNFLVAIAVLVAFFVFLFGAFENLLSTIPDVKMQGKNRMKNAIIGLVIIFISGVVLYWINPYIFSARLILYTITELKIEYDVEKVIDLLKSGQGKVLTFSQSPRCKEFLTAIDELVNAGVGINIYPLTDYKLPDENGNPTIPLTKNGVKALLKALLQTESGGHGCDPRNWGRGEYSFATFGIEYGKANDGTRSERKEKREKAYNILIREANKVYKDLPPSIQNRINIDFNNISAEEIRVGGKLDNPYLITALVIKRLHRYKELLIKQGSQSYSDNLIAILNVYKTGRPTAQHQAVADIITTVKKYNNG